MALLYLRLGPGYRFSAGNLSLLWQITDENMPLKTIPMCTRFQIVVVAKLVGCEPKISDTFASNQVGQSKAFIANQNKCKLDSNATKIKS